MRRALFSFGLLLLAIGTALAAWPSSSKFAGGGSPPANSKIWTFCNTLPLTSPCTVQGAVTNGSSVASIGTVVSRWGLAGINSLSGFGHIQLVLRGPTSGTLNINQIWIGAGQTTGGGKCSSNTSFCQWDFVPSSPAPVQVTFSSSGSVAIGNVTKTSDIMAFVGSTTNPLMVAIQFTNPFTWDYVLPSSTTVSPPGSTFSLNNYNTWWLTSVNQASTVQKNSGYSSTCSFCGNKIVGVVQVLASP